MSESKSWILRPKMMLMSVQILKCVLWIDLVAKNQKLRSCQEGIVTHSTTHPFVQASRGNEHRQKSAYESPASIKLKCLEKCSCCRKKLKTTHPPQIGKQGRKSCIKETRRYWSLDEGRNSRQYNFINTVSRQQV